MNETSAPSPTANPAGPLAGLRVLDFSRALAGPFCSMILGDLGADVIKVEATPGGDMSRGWGPFQDGTSTYFLSANRNKRSLAIDFRNPGARALLHRLAAGSDVLVENFRPGVTAAMGIDPATVQALNPRLIYASVTGFGSQGPYADRPGFDQIAQGMSGFMALTGYAEGPPTRVGVPIGDMTSGMWTVIGVLAAALEREATGRGKIVETSLLGSLIGLLGVQGQRFLSLGEEPRRAGNDHPTLFPYGVFETANGPLNIAAATESMWRSLAKVVGQPELGDDPKFHDNAARVAHLEDLRAVLHASLALHTKEEWTERLLEAGVPAGPISTMAEMFSDPHVQQTGRIVEVEHPQLGNIRLAASPLDGIAAARIRPPPGFGEHTRELLSEYGFSEAEAEMALASGLVVAPSQVG